MKVVVTGAGGFLGRWTVQHLKESGHDVDGIDLQGADSNVDLMKLNATEAILKITEPEIIIQLAALAGSTGKGGGAESLKDPYRFLDINQKIVLNVYEACRNLGIKKAICMSSFSPYGKASCPIDENTPFNPNNPYGASKANVENIAKVYAQCFGIKTIIFRVPLICGEGQKELNALKEFVKSAIKGEEMAVWGNGGTLREFVHPLDVARAYGLALGYFDKMRMPYDTFVLGNEPISMLNLAEVVVSRVGRGRVKLLPDKPRMFDQWTRRNKAETKLEWTPRIGIEEIVDRVVTEAMG
jgi:nucleoside-diphosphate-sugar epimerase